MIPFPNIDPVIFSIGPFAPRWYGLSYALGIFFTLKYTQYISKKFNLAITHDNLDDFLLWAVLGVVCGGRLGYVVFYTPQMFLNDPMYLFRITDGGMSFHGALIGVFLAVFFYCKKYKLSMLSLLDLLTCGVPIGLFLGRIANFINGELWGRYTDAAWGVVFPGEVLARHPSQIYEALTEGLLLFVIVNILLYTTNSIFKKGRLISITLLLYAIFRSFCELYREPDAHIGYIFNLTMGQILSSLMILAALLILYFNRKNEELSRS